MRLFSFYKAFRIRIVFIIVCTFYALFTCVIFSDSKTVGKTVRRSIHSVPEDTSREAADFPEVINISKFQSENVKDINSRYWELIRDKLNDSATELFGDNNSAVHMNISEFALTIRNLWSANDYLNPIAEYDDRILAQMIWSMETAKNPSINQLKTKKILLENSFQRWDFKGNEEFRRDCPGFGNKCEFLQGPDYSKLLTSADVDAVITIRAGFGTERLYLSDEVLQFFVLLESPFHAGVVFQRQNDILASYWKASHLVTPYAKWVYYNQSIKRHNQEINYAAGKTKLAAILTSNCYPANNRLVYVKLLQKHIKVDVYGSCGPLQCPRETCFKEIKKQYKFYLAFENSNCRDYITEKFFVNALSNDMVPVVMGSHPSDYRTGAPENSYIHVEDFQSPQALAEYLQYLDENDTEYNKYFEWKGLGEFIDTKFLCRACAMMHYADFVPPPKMDTVFVWEDIPKHKLCLKKHKVYWNPRTPK